MVDGVHDSKRWHLILLFCSLVPTVQTALCDSNADVRAAAARTFDALHTTVGARALDDILPYLLERLEDPETHEHTLDGLRQVEYLHCYC